MSSTNLNKYEIRAILVHYQFPESTRIVGPGEPMPSTGLQRGGPSSIVKIDVTGIQEIRDLYLVTENDLLTHREAMDAALQNDTVMLRPVSTNAS